MSRADHIGYIGGELWIFGLSDSLQALIRGGCGVRRRRRAA
jgi:hypothetical protein